MKKNVIVIDFDNTIGYFTQIVYIINIIEKAYNEKINNIDLFPLLECYTYILKPKILQVIEYIISLRQNNLIKYFILYTRNKNINFISCILNYIKRKLNINGEISIFNYIIITHNRDKSIEELCEYINEDSNNINIYFIDNHKYLFYNNKQIVYICCRKYIHMYTLKHIISNFPYNIYPKVNSKIIKYVFHQLKQTNKHIIVDNTIPLALYDHSSLQIIFHINKYIK